MRLVTDLIAVDRPIHGVNWIASEKWRTTEVRDVWPLLWAVDRAGCWLLIQTRNSYYAVLLEG
jgi:hypothetical protein